MGGRFSYRAAERKGESFRYMVRGTVGWLEGALVLDFRLRSRVRGKKTTQNSTFKSRKCQFERCEISQDYYQALLRALLFCMFVEDFCFHLFYQIGQACSSSRPNKQQLPKEAWSRLQRYMLQERLPPWFLKIHLDLECVFCIFFFRLTARKRLVIGQHGECVARWHLLVPRAEAL